VPAYRAEHRSGARWLYLRPVGSSIGYESSRRASYVGVSGRRGGEIYPLPARSDETLLPGAEFPRHTPSGGASAAVGPDVQASGGTRANAHVRARAVNAAVPRLRGDSRSGETGNLCGSAITTNAIVKGVFFPRRGECFSQSERGSCVSHSWRGCPAWRATGIRIATYVQDRDRP
jgi:hypothetical protein